MVAIENLEMPSCCHECGLWHFDRDDEPVCNITYDTIKNFKERHENCPLKDMSSKTISDAIKADIHALPKAYPFADPYIREEDVIEIIDKYMKEQ